MRWTIPNILTVARLLAAPLVAVVFVVLPRPIADWAAVILFAGAAVTDWFDGYLARRFKLESKFGAMLDPIADKAMVVIALGVIMALSNLMVLIVVPAALILFREVFVSGLREFLGDTAGLLKVTKLAKWKTTVQMLAIAVLFMVGVFEHALIARSVGMTPDMVDAILRGTIPDEVGLLRAQQMFDLTLFAGRAMLVLAAVLTVVTGWDYFRKALPYLKED